MTSVAPLRSIFHPLSKWTTCLQGTKLTHFFPSLAFSVCPYFMHCISVLLPCKLPFPTHVERKSNRSRIYLSFKSISFYQTPRTSHSFFHPHRRSSFSPQSFPFCQPYFCHHRSPEKLEAQWPRRNQPTRPAPKHGLWQDHSSTQGPSSRDAHLCSWAAKINPLHRNCWSSLLHQNPSLEMYGVGCSSRVLVGK